MDELCDLIHPVLRKGDVPDTHAERCNPGSCHQRKTTDYRDTTYEVRSVVEIYRRIGVDLAFHCGNHRGRAELSRRRTGLARERWARNYFSRPPI
jgi:hypothetical protein